MRHTWIHRPLSQYHIENFCRLVSLWTPPSMFVNTITLDMRSDTFLVKELSLDCMYLRNTSDIHMTPPPKFVYLNIAIPRLFESTFSACAQGVGIDKIQRNPSCRVIQARCRILHMKVNVPICDASSSKWVEIWAQESVSLFCVFSNMNNAPPRWSYSTGHFTTFPFIVWWDTHFSLWLIFWLENRNIAVAAFSISSSEAYSGSCRNLPFIFPKKITSMYRNCFVHFLAFFVVPTLCIIRHTIKIERNGNEIPNRIFVCGRVFEIRKIDCRPN